MTTTPSLTGKTIVLTGASDGIGAAAALELAAAGADLIAVGRSEAKLAALGDRVEAAGSPRPRLIAADFARLAAVRDLATEIAGTVSQVDVLANNAGGIWPERTTTDDGHELTFQVNHLAPFLLTELLRPQLEAAPAGRVVGTASEAHRGGRLKLDDLDWVDRKYSSFPVYGTSKLENILFTAELPRRWTGTKVTSYCFHPGTVASGFARDSGIIGLPYRTFVKRFLTTAEQGADTLVYLASAPESELVDGAYYFKRKLKTPNGAARDPANASGLWERSAELVGA